MGPPAAVTLTRILHACVLVEHGPARVLIDPCFGFFARRPLTRGVTGIRMPAPGAAPESLEGLGALVLTHGHEDHADMEAIARLPSRDARVFVPAAGLARRLRRAGFRSVAVIAPWETHRFEGLSLTAVPARAPNALGEVSYVLLVGGIAVLHAGDTAWHRSFPEIADRCSPDVGCLPVNGVALLGGRLTMTPAQAARAAAALRLKAAVPIHCEMGFGRVSRILYRAAGGEASFVEAAARICPRTRVLVARRGERVDLTAAIEAPAAFG
jgi:L-ascorbate metabolism protein UlaG (beta-lactamase superfamily)